MTIFFDNLKRAKDLNLSTLQFNYFRDTIKSMAGIHLSDAKKELVASRLKTRVLALNLEDYGQYVNFLQKLTDDDPEWEIFTNLLTTNTTYFFREPQHFEFLKEEIIPHWLKTGDQSFKVWSAASSTGEEAYTLAMNLAEVLPSEKTFHIFGTDIDSKVINKAKNAVYSITRLNDVPEHFHKSAFDFGTGDIIDWVRVKPHLLSRVDFFQHNLNDQQQLFHNEFDVVFCRNVMIYFSRETIEHILKKMYLSTKPGGFLMIGHSESLQNYNSSWVYVGPSIYMKKY